MRERTLFFGVSAFWFVVAVLPVLVLVAGSVWEEGDVSWHAYETLLHNEAMLTALGNSFKLALTVATATTVVGVAMGILLGKGDLPFAGVIAVVMSITLMIPSYILAFAWASFYGKLFFDFWGVAFVLFSIYLPIVVLVTMFALRRIDPRLEEAVLLVSDWRNVLAYVTLPLLKEAILFAFLLVFILVFGEFGVANFLRYPVFATQSFIYFSAFYDFGAATAAALPVVLVVIVVLWMQRQLSQVIHVPQRAAPMLRISLGKYRLLLFIMMVFWILFWVAVPLGQLVRESGGMRYMIEAAVQGWAPMLRSLWLAGVGATLLTLFGFLAAYLAAFKIFGWWRLFDGAVLFLFALPSVVLGIGLILLWNHPYTNLIYATPWIILFGYLAKYLALTAKTIQASLIQIPPKMAEAAMLCGAKWYQVIRYIFLPMSREALVVAWVIGFVFALRETTITMLVYPAGMDTLPIYIATRMANGRPAIIASLSLWMVVLTLLPMAGILFYHLQRKAV